MPLCSLCPLTAVQKKYFESCIAKGDASVRVVDTIAFMIAAQVVKDFETLMLQYTQTVQQMCQVGEAMLSTHSHARTGV